MSISYDEEGPQVEEDTVQKTLNFLTQTYPGEAANLTRMFGRISLYPAARQQVVLGALSRYLAEAERNSYRAETGDLAQLMGSRLLSDVDSGVELGAGAGDLLRRLGKENPNKRFVGIDLSPGFVTNFQRRRGCPENTAMTSGLIDDPQDLAQVLDEWGIDPARSSVSSVLTLDRVSNPKGLLEFMARFQRALVAVLLPTSPLDDNPSIPEAERRVYTLEPDRVTPGKTRTEDREFLADYLKKEWGSETLSSTVPYVVTSSGDRQEYLLDVFSR